MEANGSDAALGFPRDVDRYRVEEVLKDNGVEATQVVYLRAEDGSSAGPFIRKVFRDGLCPVAYERLFKAQVSGATFKHLPRIWESYHDSRYHYIVMEHVGGATLSDFLAPMSVAERANATEELFPSLCDAVVELHDSFTPPIIHRDLKPENVMVAGEGIKLIDLGISREYMHGADHDTHPFVTRGYAAPEQFGFSQTDVRSDVYSLGVCLAFMLGGHNAVNSLPESIKVWKSGGLTGAPVDAWRHVIGTACEIDPVNRYSTVGRLKDAFAGKRVAAQAEASSKDEKSIASRMPVAVGVIWNILMFLIWIAIFLACANNVISPQGSLKDTPTVYNALMNFGVVLPLFTAIPLLCANYGSIRKLFPGKNVPSRKILLVADLGIAVAMMIVLFCVYMILAYAGVMHP